MSEHPASAPSPRATRCRKPRHQARPSSKVFCLPGGYGVGRNIALAVLDVSETGVCLRLREPLQQGQEVRVGLLPSEEVREVRTSGAVVWCVAADDGTHVAGIRFDRPLSFSAVQDLGRQSTL